MRSLNIGGRGVIRVGQDDLESISSAPPPRPNSGSRSTRSARCLTPRHDRLSRYRFGACVGCVHPHHLCPGSPGHRLVAGPGPRVAAAGAGRHPPRPQPTGSDGTTSVRTPSRCRSGPTVVGPPGPARARGGREAGDLDAPALIFLSRFTWCRCSGRPCQCPHLSQGRSGEPSSLTHSIWPGAVPVASPPPDGAAHTNHHGVSAQHLDPSGDLWPVRTAAPPTTPDRPRPPSLVPRAALHFRAGHVRRQADAWAGDEVLHGRARGRGRARARMSTLEAGPWDDPRRCRASGEDPRTPPGATQSSVSASRIRLIPMPSIHTSLLTAMPF